MALEIASPSPPPFSLQAVQRGKLIEKELEKEWETLSEVFSKLSDNLREPALIPPTNSSSTHTGTSSTIHCSSFLNTLTTISHTSPQTISYTNITTSNSTPKLAQTTRTTISITTTSIFGSATFHKQPPSKRKNSIKKSSRITILKVCPPILDIFPSRDIRLKRKKKYSLPLKQP